MNSPSSCGSYPDVEEEYETQYFCFGRKVLKDCLRDLVESSLHTQIEKFEKYCTTSMDMSDEAKTGLNKKCVTLLEFYLNKSKIQLGRMYQQIDDHFSISQNVVLPSDEIYQDNISEDDVKKLRCKLEKLRANALCLNAAELLMEKELTQMEFIKTNLLSSESKLASALANFDNSISDDIYNFKG